MALAKVSQASQPPTLSTFLNQTVAPGDVVLDLKNAGRVVRLGGGLRQDGDCVIVTRTGRLRHTKPNKYWIEGSQKTYVSGVGEGVVGVVTDVRFDAFQVDIGTPSLAALPRLAFEGATRRNPPSLHVGAAVYARVVKAHRDIQPELSCMDDLGRSAGFGPLTGGYLFQCSTGVARAFLGKPTFPALKALGESLSFELAVGLNGRVWVNAESPLTVIAVKNVISCSESLTPVQQLALVEKVLQGMKLGGDVRASVSKK